MHYTVALLALLAVAACTARPRRSSPQRSPAAETDHPDAAAAWWHGTMALEDGTVPADAIERAVAHRQQMVALEFDNGGIERGSIILEINRQSINSIAGFRRIVGAARPGDVLAIYVYEPELDQRAIRTVRTESR